MTIDERYEMAFGRVSDIQSHMPMLRHLASQAGRVVEFGVRTGISTIALLSGRPGWMRSYDTQPFGLADTLGAETVLATDFAFIQADDRAILPQPTDLLFIDTLHTAQQLADELRIHGNFAKKIALHDTATFGAYGEYGGPGLQSAIEAWLADNPDWSIGYVTRECNGLTVLERRACGSA